MPSFEIQSGDDFLIIEVINIYNVRYKTDFRATKFEEDDFVLFATIEYEKAKLSDVFDLGCYFEAKVIEMRRTKQIDW